MNSAYMSNLQKTIVYSPDDGGYYAEFWDSYTGKSVSIDGEEYTETYERRYQAVKAARRVLRSVLDGKATYEIVE